MSENTSTNTPAQSVTTDTTIPVLVSGFAVGVFAILSFLKFFGKDK